MNSKQSNINREIVETRVRLCLDCGKCTVVCPVARYDQDFNPRLIIQRSLGQGFFRSDDESIWSCLNCHTCVERCNYHVKFPEFIGALRTEAVRDGIPRYCSHSGMLQSLMGMMARGDIQQKRLDWLAKDIKLTEQSETQFFVGCAPYFDVIFEGLGVKTLAGVEGALRLLNLSGIPFQVLENERCCGRDLLLQGDIEGFIALAKANIEGFRRHRIKKVVTNCPECYYTLKIDYPKLVGDTGIEVVHITEVIAPLVKTGKLKPGKVDKKVTFHDPCTLGRGLRIFDAPREILSAVEGLKTTEMEQNREMSLCCGASPWVNCGTVNHRIQEERLAQAKAVNAEILVTACPKCQIHLKCAQKNSNEQVSGIEIEDITSLVARSLRGGELIG
jgi:heterodisulfide reductase subunit D